MAWGNKKEIEDMLEEGEFECLICPHIENDTKYLASNEGAFCRECGCSLYYWPNATTTIFRLSIDHQTKTSTITTAGPQ